MGDNCARLSYPRHDQTPSRKPWSQAKFNFEPEALALPTAWKLQDHGRTPARIYGRHRFSWNHGDIIGFYSKFDLSPKRGGGVTLPMDASLNLVITESIVYDYEERLLGRKGEGHQLGSHISGSAVPQLQLAQDTEALTLSHATHGG